MLLCDKDIRKLCSGDSPMISPFSETVSGGGTISFGITSAGYDLRMGPAVDVFNNALGLVVTPKLFSDPEYCKKIFVRLRELADGTPVRIPVGGYILARSLEYVRMPRHLKGRVVGKSTYARSGIIVNCTPIEPGWEGIITLEISNSCPCPAEVIVGEGIAQLEFELLTGEPEVDYAQKKGVYQITKV